MKQFFTYIPLLLFLFLFATGAFAQRGQSSYSVLTRESMRQNPDLAFKQLKRNLNNALEEGNDHVAAVCYRQIGELYHYQAAYLQALDNFYKAESLFRKQEQTLELANTWIKIGETNFYNRQYTVSLEAFEQSLSLYISVNNNDGMADALAHIGQVYEKTENLQEAKRYQYLALDHLGGIADQALIAKIYENIGSIYEDKFQLDSALLFFQKALDIIDQQDDKMAKIEVFNNLGDVFRKTGDYQTALKYTRQATSLAKDMQEHYQLASSYRDLAKTFSLMGRYDSAYHYSYAGREIHTEIFSEDMTKQLTVLQTLFELEQKDDAIVQYERERKIHYTMLLFGTAIVLLLIFLGISVISRQKLKITNGKRLYTQNQILYETQKRAMETDLHNKKLREENLKNELELKSKELTSHTLHLIQKNQLLDELKEKLNVVVKSDKRDQRKELRHIINLIQLNHNQDKNWDDFRIVFERVHEHFFDGLRAHSDGLTSSDFRLAALLKMNLGSPDISTMLGISQDSLRIARYRLRKKLNLPEGESLTTFIQRF
ncbi:tetratricopeptide repeat protein [Sphingobacterium lumbrici]|uniref:tetratricopeptide repeat protein n=1 Tax=Sphingobacterium lumbrici TaxID=2559600 RepID=UPI001125C85F|nr:tetratricopeptide repeat protein [Sphingobacterium lumbrici]